MLKNIAQTAAFLLILIFILSAIDHWVDRRVELHYERQYRELIHPHVKADCIILGTSKSGEGVNPKDLLEVGINAYNFSIDSSDPVYFDKWYRELFLGHYPKPRVIVYCVDWVMFVNKGRHFEHDSEFFPTGYFLRKIFDPEINLKMFFSNRWPLFKYRLFVFKFLKNQFSYAPWIMKDFYRGFVPVEGTGQLKKEKVTWQSEVRPGHLAALLGLLDLWEKEGIRVVFAQTPDYIPGRESDGIRRNMKILAQIAEDRQIPFIDYNGGYASPLNFDKTLFKDWTHLNKQGVQIFSPRFARDLKKVLVQKGWRQTP